MLSSLVINPPYKVDGFTTAPKISKLLTFPFGIRITYPLLFRLAFQLVLSVSIFMTVSCVSLICFSLPLQKKNFELLHTAKSLSSQKYLLLANLKEVSSYSNLFSTAETYSLKDAMEVYYAQTNNLESQKENIQYITFNGYPSIQFSGF